MKIKINIDHKVHLELYEAHLALNRLIETISEGKSKPITFDDFVSNILKSFCAKAKEHMELEG